MKKLYLKNGLYKDAKASQDASGKYICIYDEEQLIYSVYEGDRPMQNAVIFTNPPEDLPHDVILQAAEIIENFNQYYNNLNQ